MAAIFHKTKFIWDSVDDPQTLATPSEWVVDPVFDDAERCQSLGPRYWVFGTAGDPVHDTIRSLTDEEIDVHTTFITEAKDLRKSEINEHRDVILAGGFVDASSRTWSATPQDVLNLNGVCTLISLGVVTTNQTWRDATNADHSLTTTELVTLAGYMAVFVKTAYGVSWYHKAQIDALTTLTDVLAYDITTSWPS